MKNSLGLIIGMILIAVFLFACKGAKESGKNGDPVEVIEDKPIEDLEGHEESYLEELEALEKEIIQEARSLNEKGCEDGDGNYMDCVAIAFGAKPCGGPWKYLVVPQRDGTGALIEKVQVYNALEDEINKSFNRESDCLFVEEPEVECKLGKCQKVKK